jgi:hypothetical protein
MKGLIKAAGLGTRLQDLGEKHLDPQRELLLDNLVSHFMQAGKRPNTSTPTANRLKSIIRVISRSSH